MDRHKMYEQLRSMPKTKRPISTIAVEAGCHHNTVRNVLKLGKPSPLYGDVIVAAAVRIWNEWQAEQRSTAAKLIAAAETQKKAANAMLKRLAA